MRTKRTIRTLPVSVRLLPAVKQALERAASAEDRSVSSLMEAILTEWVREHDYLKERPPKT
jgi:hypothetical protein